MIIGNTKIRTFVVGLQEMPEKTDYIQKHCREAGIGEIEVFNGISAKESGLITKHTYERDNPGSGYSIGPKPVATWMSFYMLWSALNMQPDDVFLILEWDAQFRPNWKLRTEQALRDAPNDWDMIYLGNCCTNNKPKKQVKGELWNVLGVMCGHATLVRKKALPVLLKTQRKVYSPLDISVAEYAHPHLNVNVMLPRCCDQIETIIPD